MIPFILAAVGGYLIGDSMKDSKKFADGGEVRKFYKKGKYKYILINVKRKNDFQKWSNNKESLQKFIDDIKDTDVANEFNIFETEVNEKIRVGESLSMGRKRYDESFSTFELKKEFADGGEIEYTVEYEVFVDDADDPYTDNRTKTFKDLDQAIDFSNRVYASVGYEIIKDGEVVEYGYVDTKNKRLSKYADGGEVEGLDVYESVFLYVKKGLKQPFREDYLKPIGLYNTEKAKEVEASLKKKGCLNSAGAINELGKNKAKEVNNFLDGDLSRYITTGREYRKEKFESIKEKFVNNK